MLAAIRIGSLGSGRLIARVKTALSSWATRRAVTKQPIRRRKKTLHENCYRRSIHRFKFLIGSRGIETARPKTAPDRADRKRPARAPGKLETYGGWSEAYHSTECWRKQILYRRNITEHITFAEMVRRHLRADKGCAYDNVRQVIRGAHIKHKWRRGQPEPCPILDETQSPERRCVVEGTLGWLTNRCGVRTRWCKKSSTTECQPG